ncbi:hypothetical protein ACFU99_14990 [Streptomyces sp. NPDC057654]|uniref:hypothetical protein n=1 Tax=Streptomyces sp. NPDC057654 TaxID=3346196 RepID=UPI0036C4DD2D
MSASVQNHQKFYGTAVIPPHHTLWLMGHKKGETTIYLFGTAHIVRHGGPDGARGTTGDVGPASWEACPQIGNYPGQKGEEFEITAAFVPDEQSRYLLGAKTYDGIQLTPADRAEPVAGLVATQPPPGTDTAHQASVWVTLDRGGENCSTR